MYIYIKKPCKRPPSPCEQQEEARQREREWRKNIRIEKKSIKIEKPKRNKFVVLDDALFASPKDKRIRGKVR